VVLIKIGSFALFSPDGRLRGKATKKTENFVFLL